MRSTIGIDIDAPPALVFALARDVTGWERLLPHYSRSRAGRRHADGSVTCQFIARRPLIGLLGLGLPVAWRSRVSTDARKRRLRFRHLGGVTHGMDVTWFIEERSGGARVDIEHVFDRGPAQLLPTLVDRWFTRAIAGRTLSTFKALAEALAAGETLAAAEPAT
jgi:ribosome-associated toxin RatA of RatAB toxin-antitoxin module